MPFGFPKSGFTNLDYVEDFLFFLDTQAVSPVSVSPGGTRLMLSSLQHHRLANCRRLICIYSMMKDYHVLQVTGILHGTQELFAWDS